jgi:bifunctional DNase/RNase
MVDVSGARPIAEWIQMDVRGLILDPNGETPIVILRQHEGAIYLPIWIGAFEANAIALALEGVQPPRPMTHDLLRGCLERFGARLERVEIHDLIDGTFLARLLVATGTGVEAIDSRPSDAMALALRTGSPIFASRGVLEAALSSSKASEEGDEERLREWLQNARPEDLGKYQM